MGNCFQKLGHLEPEPIVQRPVAQPSANAFQRYILVSPKLTVFNLEKLKRATGNFFEDDSTRKGMFGSVYNGLIEESELEISKTDAVLPIAVKKINNEVFPGLDQWLVGLNNVSRFRHPNVAKLIGYCSENDHHLIVSEHVLKNSLDEHLLCRNADYKPLSWDERIKIALGVAKGLTFLHNQQPPVTYKDLKSHNILLNPDCEVKLSNFRLVMDGHLCPYGYAAPEYVHRGWSRAKKSDVYNFGIILLEILTGRKASDEEKPTREKSLVEWARPCLLDKNRSFEIMDKMMDGQYPKKGAYMVAMLAVQCLLSDEEHRPDMNTVVNILEKERLEEEDDGIGGKQRQSPITAIHPLQEYCDSLGITESTDTQIQEMKPPEVLLPAVEVPQSPHRRSI